MTRPICKWMSAIFHIYTLSKGNDYRNFNVSFTRLLNVVKAFVQARCLALFYKYMYIYTYICMCMYRYVQEKLVW